MEKKASAEPPGYTEPVLHHDEQQGRRGSAALNIIENPLKVGKLSLLVYRHV